MNLPSTWEKRACSYIVGTDTEAEGWYSPGADGRKPGPSMGLLHCMGGDGWRNLARSVYGEEWYAPAPRVVDRG